MEMANMNESVGELMQKISRMSNVFRVQLLKSGHSEQFKAIAHIQGSDHSYTVEMAPGNGERKSLSSTGRIFRGGSWYYTATQARSSFRGRLSRQYRDFNLGVRPARPLTAHE